MNPSNYLFIRFLQRKRNEGIYLEQSEVTLVSAAQKEAEFKELYVQSDFRFMLLEADFF
jgi:hypothetical protein